MRDNDFDREFKKTFTTARAVVWVAVVIWVSFIGLIGTGLFFGIKWLIQNT